MNIDLLFDTPLWPVSIFATGAGFMGAYFAASAFALAAKTFNIMPFNIEVFSRSGVLILTFVCRFISIHWRRAGVIALRVAQTTPRIAAHGASIDNHSRKHDPDRSPRLQRLGVHCSANAYITINAATALDSRQANRHCGSVHPVSFSSSSGSLTLSRLHPRSAG